MKLIIMSLLCAIAGTWMPMNRASAAVGDEHALTESRAHFHSSWRNTRRMGVGINFAGVYGLAAFQLELNLSEKWGTQIGYGGGPDHSAFAFQVKRVLGGHDFSPYLSTGVARWASSSEGPVGDKEVQPSFLSKKFLSEEQREAPTFEEILIPFSVGLQYAQTHGPWAGTSVFLEINALADIKDLKAATTGTLGMSYFF